MLCNAVAHYLCLLCYDTVKCDRGKMQVENNIVAEPVNVMDCRTILSKGMYRCSPIAACCSPHSVFGGGQQ